jgi:general secretion pathway protein D
VLEDGGDILDRSLDVNIGFPPAVPDIASQGRFSIGNILSDDYTALIQALAEDSDTETIASPRILVRDGAQAVFSSARDEPYTVVTVDGNTQTTLQDVRFLNIGVNLSVAPEINLQDFVTMDVSVEISSLVDIRDGIPVADRSTAQSTVTVRNRGAIILGGLRQSSRSNTERGVPALRKIPLFGNLFKNNRKDKSEFEIILILRPIIIEEAATEVPTPEEIQERTLNNFNKESLGRIRHEND